MKKGSLSINSENLLPIIKKWLYSDTDIFLRELVSNGCDAVNKFRKLVSMGEAEGGESYKVVVSLDKEKGTITVSDNGIGMTEDEIKEYINQIAFSGANAFIDKYKDKIGGENDIIGHFGLGFYSAFMVAEQVEIESLSYAEGAAPAHWICDGGIEFELGEGSRTERGTDVILHISEDRKEFLNAYKIKEILTKYCYFMNVEIYFEDIDEIRKKEAETANTEIKENAGNEKAEEPKPINDISPLWLKNPGDVTEEEYKSFYHKVFTDFNDPLFWIHLNMDYPFKLKGILYFPKLRSEFDSIEGQVKLYNNQVFIADNIKEVIPDFLLLLKGTIDCPDLPLNVSRSFLQNDGYVTKISRYIIKKVGDKLNSLFKKDREAYEKYWEDINVFIKYGCLRDEDFYKKIKDSLLYKSTDKGYKTLTEYIDANESKLGKKVVYVSDEQLQAQYVNMFRENGLEAVVLSNQIDTPYINYMEMYNEGVKFARIDSEITEVLKDKDVSEETSGKLINMFKDILDDESLTVRVEALKADNVSAVIELSEQSRRMQEMSKLYGFGGEMPMALTLILNSENDVIKYLAGMDDEKTEEKELIVKQVYDLASLSHRTLSAEEMTAFIERSNRILGKIK